MSTSCLNINIIKNKKKRTLSWTSAYFEVEGSKMMYSICKLRYCSNLMERHVTGIKIHMDRCSLKCKYSHREKERPPSFSIIILFIYQGLINNFMVLTNFSNLTNNHRWQKNKTKQQMSIYSLLILCVFFSPLNETMWVGGGFIRYTITTSNM